jgi:DNA-directed RNA polymerase subunit RPC12/RpoP
VPVRTLRRGVPRDLCFAGTTAYHLYVWYDLNRYCGRCGHPTVLSEKERALICPDCGQSMLLHTDGRNPNRPLGERSYFQCSTYRCYGKDKCSSHRISVNSLYDAVLKDIQYHARLAMDDPEGYVRQTLEHMDNSTAQRRNEIQQEKTSLQAQNESLSQQFIRLYDDFSRGLVSER